MSIEQTLERIAVALEKLDTRLAAIDANAGQSPVTSAPGPSGTGPGQLPPQVAPAPVAPAPVAPAPVAPAPVAPAPVPQPGPGPAPVVAGDLVDQIREAANAFHRAHPERAGEVFAIISPVQTLDAIPATAQAGVLQKIQKLGA